MLGAEIRLSRGRGALTHRAPFLNLKSGHGAEVWLESVVTFSLLIPKCLELLVIPSLCVGRACSQWVSKEGTG